MHRLVVPAVVLIAGLIGPFNPLDTVARGKFVRAFQTRKGEASATVCIPAETAQQVPGFLTDLPRVLRALEAAGARAVVFDVVPMPSATEGQTRLPVVADSAVTYSATQTPGSGAKVRSPVSGVVIGADWQALPIAVAALGAHRGLPASDSSGDTSGDTGSPRKRASSCGCQGGGGAALVFGLWATLGWGALGRRRAPHG